MTDRLFDLEAIPHALQLKDRFILPPFTVLDTRGGWWQGRKGMWGDLGLRSMEGRDARMLAKSVGNTVLIDEATGLEYFEGAPPGSVNWKILQVSNGQSIFDPVLCELGYRWFCPPGGSILDPFAGGSVRGLVAEYLGYRYTGIDLRGEQVAANESQAQQWVDKGTLNRPPTWIVGDSTNPISYPDERFDFVWSCPPYHDLEHYSEDPDDLSNMSYDGFLQAYWNAIANACERLKPNRFAGFVVGEIRDKKGMYRNFVGHTIEAFQACAGVEYYNEAIIVNSTGTLALRAGKQFSVSRKLGKTHQQVLMFVKGDPRKAAEACGEVRTVTDYPTEGDA